VRVFFFGSLLNLVAIFAFSFSQSFQVAMVILFVAGLCSTCVSANQSVIVFLSKIRGMRSRMMGALIMCVGVGYFGLLHPGFMAGVYGRAMAVAVMPAEGLVARVAVFLLWPVLRKSR